MTLLLLKWNALQHSYLLHVSLNKKYDFLNFDVSTLLYLSQNVKELISTFSLLFSCFDKTRRFQKRVQR
jgi:hypothetical protein